MGRLIKDFGPQSGVGFFGANVNYFDLKADSPPKLRRYMDEIHSPAEERSNPRHPPPRWKESFPGGRKKR